MTVLWRDGQMVLRRVRVRQSGLDPLTTRLRTGRLLAAADLRPAGLAPSAILCVRHFPDPLPGALGLHRGSARPAASWARAATAALDDLVAGAARPALGPVPANARAVLFADRAELLACL